MPSKADGSAVIVKGKKAIAVATYPDTSPLPPSVNYLKN
jgi:hypothetical protein